MRGRQGGSSREPDADSRRTLYGAETLVENGSLQKIAAEVDVRSAVELPPD